MTPEKLILNYLSQEGAEALKPRALARRLADSKKDRQLLEQDILLLIAEGKLLQTAQGHVLLPGNKTGRKKGQQVGTVRRTATGGWFIPKTPGTGTFKDGNGDIFLYPEDLADAQTGDTVLVRLLDRKRTGGRLTGRVDEVLSRATHTYVGTYIEEWNQGRVRVDGGVFEQPVSVGDPGARGARPNDKVVIEMVRFPTTTRAGEAVLTKILGVRGEPGVDELTVIHELGLPQDFPEEVLEEARAVADRFNPEELGDRLDLTGELIVTIDPMDARDFDDAISLRKSDDGHWHLGVHVADVGHFVRAGSRLDEEARRRGTSVYLPGRVLPMIPEIISNSLASLQAGQVRFTKTVRIEFSPEGTVLNASFHDSAIKVAQRFAYEQVMPILREPQKHRDAARPKVRQLLKRMHELAMLLRQRRFEQGAIELFLPETKLELDDNGAVAAVHEAVHDESHQIIEEFMLAANMAVATELDGRGIRFLRRVHGRPDPIKLQAFAEFVESLGFPAKKFWSREGLQTILAEVRGQPFEQAVNYALLRSMKQAEYSGETIGHYALSAEHYCHFTSPIRRYPDLTVHRLLEQLIARDAARRPTDKQHEAPASGRVQHDASVSDSVRTVGLSEELALQLGEQCSALERRAAKGERELTRIKLLRLLETKRDETFPAIITGVERVGLFCRCVPYPVDGFLPIAVLGREEPIDYDRSTMTMTGRRSGCVYRLGEVLAVRIAAIDVDQRSLTWTLAGPPQAVRRKGFQSEVATSKSNRATSKSFKKSRKPDRQRDSRAASSDRPRGKSKTGKPRKRKR